jgi:hypothetical protein
MLGLVENPSTRSRDMPVAGQAEARSGALNQSQRQRASMTRILDYRILVYAAASILVLGPIYYAIGQFVDTEISIWKMYYFTAVAGASVLLGYQIFFSIQALVVRRKLRVLYTSIDKYIPFVVQWVWVYGALYYLVLGLPLAFFSRFSQCLTYVSGGFVILLLSTPIFLLLPTRCPPEWRNYKRSDISSRFLAFIQHFDVGVNCCPSLHCALTAYAASFIPSYTILFVTPIVISLSCSFVKQHSVLELPASLIFGFIIGFVVNQLMIK